VLGLANQGIDAAGEVALPVGGDLAVVDPGAASAGDDGLRWTFELAEGERVDHSFWLRPDPTVAALTLEASILIQEEGGEATEHAVLAFALDLASSPRLCDALDRLNALAAGEPKIYGDARERVEAAYVAYHAGDLDAALSEGLEAAGALAAIDSAPAAEARQLLAAVIRWLQVQIATR
jgi:hypothetical protein